MKKITIPFFLMIILLVLLISACDSKDNAKEDIIYESIQYTILMQDSINEEFLDGFNESINAFLDKNSKNATEEEMKILENLKELQDSYLSTKVLITSGISKDTGKFDAQYKVMEELLGASNLDHENYDKEAMAKRLAEYKE